MDFQPDARWHLSDLGPESYQAAGCGYGASLDLVYAEVKLWFITIFGGITSTETHPMSFRVFFSSGRFTSRESLKDLLKDGSFHHPLFHLF